MSFTSHNRAYQDFLTLLTEFNELISNSSANTSKSVVKQQFGQLQQWFEQNIDNITGEKIEITYVPRWESIQREIKREFKLLNTDVLFLASARQAITKNKRLKSIGDRLTKLSSYCQGIIEETRNKE